ncbi:unnamed protein product, partial [Ostreobium quekettii]
ALKEVQFHQPRIPVYSNVTSEPFSSSGRIPELLGRQLTEPVQWEDTMKKLLEAGKKELFELGPGHQIKAMVKRMDANVWKGFKNVAA